MEFSSYSTFRKSYFELGHYIKIKWLDNFGNTCAIQILVLQACKTLASRLQGFKLFLTSHYVNRTPVNILIRAAVNFYPQAII